MQSRVSALLRFADIGVDGLRLTQRIDPEGPIRFDSLLGLGLDSPAETIKRHPAKDSGIEFLHRVGDRTIAFPPLNESQGTLAYFSLLGPIVLALALGGRICIDELDESLHSLLGNEIVRLFNSREDNPLGAQLIFSTHDTNLLTAGQLRRDQVWLTEKARDGSSKLYPLTDFKPRKDENIEKGYLQGRYGGIPFFDTEALIAAMRPADAAK